MASPAGSDGADDVVLTGMSGRFPESDTIDEFADQLYAGVDTVAVSGRRRSPGIYGVTERCGTLKDLSYFDATFFGVHAKQAEAMDPQQRILLEVAYEAVVDAGLSPAELRGSRTGVFVSLCCSDSYYAMMNSNDPDKLSGYAVTGCCLALAANRISYTFDLKGPSFSMDTACSASLSALAQAVEAMQGGHCDAAIVASTNLLLEPMTTLNLHRLTMLSPDGRCASFDAAGNGYVRSEAVVAVMLQRRGAARRVYATLRGARHNNEGHKEEGITHPSGDMQRRLAQETFEAAGLRPQDVVYIEAHGPGTKVGDPLEIGAIVDVFCKDREQPLPIGSVKSNMGHSEASSGLCSVVKVALAMERGVIPGNLHYRTPNPDIPALTDGRVQVVTSNTKWDGGLVAVNSFGFGGSIVHVIMESGKDSQAPPAPATDVPRLAVASGRTEHAVRALLAHAHAHRADAALLALLHAVHARPIAGHPYRGYRLLDDPPHEEILEMEDGGARPVWFVFPGMGSQWPGMARALLALPVFAASVAHSAHALRPLGVDLLHVLTEADDEALRDVTNSFVAITAVQVALVDVLREVGITADGVVGHSFGEIGCAYADGALSAEQAVLCAYWRGRIIADGAPPPGAMAAVGLSWDDARRRCPPDVAAACHNADDNVTVSGPVDSIEKFVAKLTAEGIFARRVNSCGVAFHSQYVAAAAPLLRKRLQEVIPSPKPRSKRWVSTSLSDEQWDSEMGKLCSAEYHVNNLVSPVRLARALRQIPERAVVVEVAPHALLAAVLRRAAPRRAAYVPLVRREAPDAARHLLAALGRLFAAGCQPQLHRLYPRVPWPVPRGTPGLASLVRWDRSLKWGVYDDCIPQRAGDNVVECDLSRAEDAFLAGHDIDGRIPFPATGYLALVWRTMARLHGKKPEETCVVLENVHFQRETIVSQKVPVQFHVNIMEGSGYFEVRQGGGLAASGNVRVPSDRAAERLAMPAAPPASTDDDLLPLDTDDVYTELRLRGYNYGGVFRGIRRFDPRSDAGELAWNDNWIAFMDAMLQSDLVSRDAPGLCLTTRLQRVVIDPVAQAEALARVDGMLPVRVCRDIGVIASGGVEMRGVKTSMTARRVGPQLVPKLEQQVFVPYDNAVVSTEDNALLVSLQIALEQAGWARVRVLEASLGACREPSALLPRALRLLAAEPGVAVEKVLLAGAGAASSAELQNLGVQVTNKSIESDATLTDWHVVLAEDVLSKHSDALPSLERALAACGTLVLREPSQTLHDHARQALHAAGLQVLSVKAAEGCAYVLLGRKAPQIEAWEAIEATTAEPYAWLPRLRVALRRAGAAEDCRRVYLWSREPEAGVLGLAACARREAGGRALRVYLVPGARAAWAPDAPEYRARVHADLAVNVLRDGVWGSYRRLPLGDAPLVQVEHAAVDMLVRGDLSSLRWVQSAPRPAAGEDSCRVSHAAVDCRRASLTTGALEFSGWCSDGARVMGVVSARGPATSVPCAGALLWPAPAAWSLAQAATVPVAYATAYYALAVRGRARRGHAVLVAAAGGAGLAAVAVALHAGCVVFAVAGSPGERAALLDGFPGLRPENVGSSRDASFEQLVLSRTRGRGVDLVLNSLAGDLRMAAVRCLAEGGRFLDIGEPDLSADAPLDWSVFPRNATFHAVDLDALLDAPNDDPERAAVVRRVAEGVADGTVRPLRATVFSDRQLEEAFRYAASGRHDAKALVCVPELMPAVARVPLDPGRGYVVVGGGERGLRLGGWLAARGARRLVLAVREERRGPQARAVRRWRHAGARVLVRPADVGSPGGARRLLRDAADLAPVAGIFILATERAVPEGLLENITEDDCRVVAEHTIDVTRALDTASRELALQLEHFVVFLSEASGRGRAGLGHFGLADAASECVVERRRADSLPGLAIQWPQCASDVDEERLLDAALGELLARDTPAVVACCVPEYQDAKATASPAQDLVQVVANILGIRDPARAPQTATLAELGMDSLMAAEVQHALHALHVPLDVRDARALTFARLRELAGGEAPATGTSGV